MKTKWLSPPILEVNGRRVYRQCRTKFGDCISIGDFVQLLPAEPGLDLFVGRVESMYEDSSNGYKCIHIRWFYRPTDLQHDPPLQPLENELYHTKYYDCQLVESIFGRCKIIERDVYLKIKARNTNERTIDGVDTVYVCGYSYSAEEGAFFVIKKEDLEGQEANLPYSDINEDQNRRTKVEDIDLARQYAKDLIYIEQLVPPEMTSKDWSIAKRLPWVLKAKNAMTADDIKQIMIELEIGLKVFEDQADWTEIVHAINTIHTVADPINYLRHHVQKKIEHVIGNHEMMIQSKFETRKRKRLPIDRAEKLKQQTKEADTDEIKAGNAYEIEHVNLASEVPIDLRLLRSVLVTHSSNESVTIKFPTLSSLTRYFRGCGDDYDVLQNQRPTTRSLSLNGDNLSGTRPCLDGELVLSHSLAKKVLKKPIPLHDYRHLRHLKTFWYRMVSVTTISTSKSKTENSQRPFSTAQKVDGDNPEDCKISEYEDKMQKDRYNVSVKWGARKRIIYQPCSPADSSVDIDSHAQGTAFITLDSCQGKLPGKWSNSYNRCSTKIPCSTEEITQLKDIMKIMSMETPVAHSQAKSLPGDDSCRLWAIVTKQQNYERQENNLFWCEPCSQITEMTALGKLHQLVNMENYMHKNIHSGTSEFVQEATSRFMSVSNEKKILAAQMDELTRSVEVTMEDVTVVMSSSNAHENFPSDCHNLFDFAIKSRDTGGTSEYGADSLRWNLGDILGEDNVFLFRRAALESSVPKHCSMNLDNSSQRLVESFTVSHTTPEANHSQREGNSSGFRYWKPATSTGTQ